MGNGASTVPISVGEIDEGQKSADDIDEPVNLTLSRKSSSNSSIKSKKRYIEESCNDELEIPSGNQSLIYNRNNGQGTSNTRNTDKRINDNDSYNKSFDHDNAVDREVKSYNGRASHRMTSPTEGSSSSYNKSNPNNPQAFRNPLIKNISNPTIEADETMSSPRNPNITASLGKRLSSMGILDSDFDDQGSPRLSRLASDQLSLTSPTQKGRMGTIVITDDTLDSAPGSLATNNRSNTPIDEENDRKSSIISISSDTRSTTRSVTRKKRAGKVVTINTNSESTASVKQGNTSTDQKPFSNRASGNVSDATEDDEDMKPMDILFQFIPYYGHGNPVNDSTVRAALSNLSVSEIDYKDSYGNTLLLLVCQYRCEDLVRIILNKGGDPNASNHHGITGLHYSCYRDSLSMNIAKILLQNGANPEIKELTYGCTPLHYCVGSGDIEFCKLLISYGASVMTYDYYNYTAIDYARDAGFTTLVMYLAHVVSKVNKKGSNEWVSYVDEPSGQRYYCNQITGESLWEHDYYQRLHTDSLDKPTSSIQDDSNASDNDKSVLVTTESKAASKPEETKENDESNDIIDTNQTLSSQSIPSEQPVVIRDSGSPLDRPTSSRERKPNRPESPAPSSPSSLSASLNSTAMSKLLRKNLNGTNQLAAKTGNSRNSPRDNSSSNTFILTPKTHIEALNELKQQHITELESERRKYQLKLSEQQGQIAKLMSDIENITSDRVKLETERLEVLTRLEQAYLQQQSSQNDFQIKHLESHIQILQQDNQSLKLQYNTLQQEITSKQEIIRNYESSILKLSQAQSNAANTSATITDMSKQIEERSKQLQEKESYYKKIVQDLTDKLSSQEKTLHDQYADMLANHEKKEKELMDIISKSTQGHGDDIKSLQREITELKSHSAREKSLLESELENQRLKSKDCEARTELAEREMRGLMAEVDEARVLKQQIIQLHKDFQREQAARRRLHNELEDLKGKIRVYVRIRPMSKSEMDRKCEEAVMKDGKMAIMLKGLNGPDSKKIYEFDQVFGGSDGNSQEEVFRDSKHLVMSVVDGYNVCIFAYGQTGAGKSFTMIGAADIGSCLRDDGDFDESAGIAPRAVVELFRLLKERDNQITYQIEVQMFQLYRDNLEDLLYDKRGKRSLNEPPPDLKIILAEHSPTGLVQVDGAVSMSANSAQDVLRIFAKGSSQRTTASTKMNAESSRSHLICSITVTMINKRTNSQTLGKLTLVDLAGSERLDKSGATGENLKEAQSINKSLSALGDVIGALTTSQPHIPYRNHPLTMLMSDSIGGNSKTLMFINTSPADYNVAESNSSLGFGMRCKDVTNSAPGSNNPAIQQAQLNALKKELNRLKKANMNTGNLNTISNSPTHGSGVAGMANRIPGGSLLSRPI